MRTSRSLIAVSLLAASLLSTGGGTSNTSAGATQPGSETSGTAFDTYAYLWGINHGVLDK